MQIELETHADIQLCLTQYYLLLCEHVCQISRVKFHFLLKYILISGLVYIVPEASSPYQGVARLAQSVTSSLISNAARVRSTTWEVCDMAGGRQIGQVGFPRALQFPPTLTRWPGPACRALRGIDSNTR